MFLWVDDLRADGNSDLEMINDEIPMTNRGQ
jgi:hypothetical protein